MKTEIVAMNEGCIRILIILLQDGVVDSCLLRAGFVGLEQKGFASSFPLHAVTPHSITQTQLCKTLPSRRCPSDGAHC